MATPNNIGVIKAAAMIDIARFSEGDSGVYAFMNAILTAIPRRRLIVSTNEAMAIPIRNAMCVTTVLAVLEIVFILLENVKEHAPLSARAHVDHGVEVKTREDHENRAADRGCVSRLVRASAFRMQIAVNIGK
jgi:hypothetical protein